MPSPFPGMDPFLEEDKLWTTFHNHLVQNLYQALLPSLSDRYRTRVSERSYVMEQVLFTSVLREERREPFIEIRQRSDSKVVTLVDVVSPANKTTLFGRDSFLGKREETIKAKGNVVEIDLILQGSPLHDFSREKLPEWDYAVLVTRATRPEQWEIYTATLDKRLPRFRLPLASDDRDTVLDLQVAVQRAFDAGDFGTLIGYERDPITKLSETQKKWIDLRLREQKIRQ